MTKATATRTERTETVTIEKKVPTITLELTMEQAATLHSVGRHVGGTPETSIRGYMQAITDSLREAGVPYISGGLSKGSTSLHFTEDSLPALKAALEPKVSAPVTAVRQVGIYKTEHGFQFWDGSVWGCYVGKWEQARDYAGQRTICPPNHFEFVAP